MRPFIGIFIAGIIFSITLLSSCNLFQSKDKTAFVYVNKVLDEYVRMQEARNRLDTIHSQLKAKVDESVQTLKKEVAVFEAEKKELSAEQITAGEQRLLKMQQEHTALERSVPQKMEEMKNKFFTPAIADVNRFVEEYGKKHNMTYVFGNLGSGNIMYASDANDITNKVIEGLNKEYEQLLIGN